MSNFTINQRKSQIINEENRSLVPSRRFSLFIPLIFCFLPVGVKKEMKNSQIERLRFVYLDRKKLVQILSVDRLRRHLY